jgi:spermidine synthase
VAVEGLFNPFLRFNCDPDDRRIEDVLLRTQTAHNAMLVRRVGEGVQMEVDGGLLSAWHPTRLLTGMCWDAVTAGVLMRVAGPPASVLLLGLGGGTVARQLRAFAPAARIVGVEIDAAVIDAARAHLGLDDSRVEVVIGDATTYLAQGDERFDAVVDDLYLGTQEGLRRGAASHRELAGALRARCAAGGVVVANVFTGPERTAPRAEAHAAFRAAFAATRALLPPAGDNEVLVGGDALAPWPAVQALARVFADPRDRSLWRQCTCTPVK